MLQLKLCFPRFSRCIRGITDQHSLPLTSECLIMIDPPPRPPGPGLKTKEGWHQPTLFDDF